MIFDCAIIGGGLAGLQAAVQLGRYKHKVVVIDSGDGRSAICRCYHNILGWPEGVSGERLRQLGRLHAERLGIAFAHARVSKAEYRSAVTFLLTTEEGETYEAKRLLLATGVKDRIPLKGQLLPCLGVSLFICPDCDGYETADKRTLVLGSGNSGASMAIALRYWTDEIIYINHERKEIAPEIWSELGRQQIVYIEDSIAEVAQSGGKLQGVTLESGGKFVPGEHAFVSFGGNEVRTELAAQLGVRLTDNGHIEVDPRTKMTSKMHVWAAGDVTQHSEQAVIAIGDGSQAAIWIHKSLLL